MWHLMTPNALRRWPKPLKAAVSPVMVWELKLSEWGLCFSLGGGVDA